LKGSEVRKPSPSEVTKRRAVFLISKFSFRLCAFEPLRLCVKTCWSRSVEILQRKGAKKQRRRDFELLKGSEVRNQVLLKSLKGGLFSDYQNSVFAFVPLNLCVFALRPVWRVTAKTKSLPDLHNF